jgi:uncharacterized membrane protein YjjB (DUF3815 family)
MTAARIATVVSAAAVASAAAAISYQSPRRLVVLGAALGAFGFALMVLVDPIVESIGVATAVPAFGIGMAARLTGVRVQVPTVLITVPAIIPLLPGLAVFQGLLALVQNDPLKGIAALVQAASISIALAAGVLLGQFIGGRLTHRPGFTGTFLREGFGIHSRS